MQRDSEFLATEKPSKLLLKLALPAVTAQLVNMLYNIVDRMYIGRLEGIGTEALAGVGACLPVILLVSAFAALASMGGAPRASIFMGQGDQESAERTMGNCNDAFARPRRRAHRRAAHLPKAHPPHLRRAAGDAAPRP